MRRLCSCLLAAELLIAGAGLSRLSPAAQRPAAAVAGAATSTGELRGAGSCAAAACHNGNGPKGSTGSEYTTWVVHDPHARAFEVLYGKRSLQIEKNRQPPAGVEKDHPESDPLCLNCHVQPGIEPMAKGGEKLPRRKAFALEDGVSCEACHGAAGGWLTRHYAADWRDKTAAQKAAEGMSDTKDLRVRAEVCVRCHVGEGDLDVNHQLIAAGHPRLKFEYGGFLANLPKHWSEEKDKAGRPDFEARAWALGQVVSSKAALNLLAHRADAKNKRPWPEFAEYDCFACHHDLKGQTWPGDRRRRKEPPGTLAWGTWYFPMLPDALGAEVPGELDDDLSALRDHMEQFGADQKGVADTARSAADRLQPWVERVGKREYDGAALDRALKQFATDDRHVSEANWDGAAQLSLAIGAFYSARGDVDPRKRDPQLKARIRALGERLDFPPPSAGGRRNEGPPENWPTTVPQALEGIRQGLQK